MPYPSDATIRTSTLALLGTVWKKLPRGVALARAWGADWLDWSEPFVRVEGGEVVAHVGVMEIAAVIDGRPKTFAGIHAVCTRQDLRGRGYLRETMARTLAWVDTRYESAVLWANDREIYTRFGFVARPEAMFRAALPARDARDAARSSGRVLVLENAADLGLVRDAIAARVPVSSRCGSQEPGWLTLINLGLWPDPSLAFVPELDCVVMYEVRDRVLRLYDVVARTMPSLESLATHFAATFAPDADALEVFFSPEGLAAADLSAAPTSLGDFLMERGSLLTGSAPFAFSPLSRC